MARVVVDPGFRGPFPLAGVRCQVIAGRKGPQGALRLRFVELSAEVEAGIVRAIHQRQLGLKQAGRQRGRAGVGGRGGTRDYHQMEI